jgi:hypothetical protein
MKRRDFLAAGVGATVAALTPAAAIAAALPAPLHVFRLNDFEWYLAPSLEAAIAEWKEDTGLTDEELDDPRQLSEEDLDRLKFCHTDEDESPIRTITFRERVAEMIAEGTTGAAFFATTEY